MPLIPVVNFDAVYTLLLNIENLIEFAGKTAFSRGLRINSLIDIKRTYINITNNIIDSFFIFSAPSRMQNTWLIFEGTPPPIVENSLQAHPLIFLKKRK